MKNLLLAVTLISLTFLSCSKKDDDIDTTIYEGTWRGTYNGASNGTWIMNVSGIGTLTKTWENGDGTGSGTASGTVTESGLVKQNFSNGGKETGQLNAELGTYSGIWSRESSTNQYGGNSSGTKD